MNLETVNAIAQLLAATGVIASLFYLAAQIRQNTRSMRAVVVDSFAHSLIDLLGPQAFDLEFTRAFSRVTKDWNAASEEDRMRTVAVLIVYAEAFRKRLVFKDVRARWTRSSGRDGMPYARMYFHLPGVKTLVAVAAGDLCRGISRVC